MVIIPTEKRFDWNYAPVVLFSIVLINILVFFVYQSGDGEKFERAFTEYKKQEYLAIEWPFFKKYLTEKGDQSSLKKFQHLYDDKKHDELIFHIIVRLEFYRYLRFGNEQYTYFATTDVGDWFEKREKIYNQIKSTSVSSFGLTPSQLNFFHLFSYQFLHGDIMHLLGNMFFLIVCGFAVEAAIGRWRFLAFYLICGITGGLLHTLFNLKEAMPLVGASGSISGIMAMYLGLFRLKKIEFFYWFFIFVGYFKAPALFILAFYIGKEVFQFFTSSGSNVAFMAHAGGFISGGLLMAACYRFIPHIFNQTYIEEDQTIDPAQEKLATIYEFIEKYQFEAAEKALTRAINEMGNNFDFSLLQYNLSKINDTKKHSEYVVNIIKTKHPTDREIKKIEQVWMENPKSHDQFTQEELVKLGMHFSSLSNPESAAIICDRLVEQHYNDSSLNILAKKLSIAFGSLNNFEKKQKYEAIANQPLPGGPGGVL